MNSFLEVRYELCDDDPSLFPPPLLSPTVFFREAVG